MKGMVLGRTSGLIVDLNAGNVKRFTNQGLLLFLPIRFLMKLGKCQQASQRVGQIIAQDDVPFTDSSHIAWNINNRKSACEWWLIRGKGHSELSADKSEFVSTPFLPTHSSSFSFLIFLKNKERFKSNAHSLHYLIRPHSQPTCIELLNTINCNSLPEWRGQSGGEATEYEYLSACLFAKMKSTGRLTLTLPSPLFDLTHPKLTNEMLLKGFH